MSETAYFYGSTLLLSALLYVPVQRMIWTLSVRRLQRKLKRELSAEEIRGQSRRAHFIAILVTPIFSLLFNLGLHKPQ